MPLYGLILICTAAVSFAGMYAFLTAVFSIPSRKTKIALKRIKSSDDKKPGLYDMLLSPLVKKAADLIRLQPHKRNKLSVGLKKAGIGMEPEEYIAQAAVKSLLTACAGLLFILLGIPSAAMGCIFLSIAMYFKEKGKVDTVLKKTNEKILKELPRFIRTFSHSLKGTDDIIKIFETYRKVAGKAFQYDLDVLITDLKIGNHEEALKRFDERLNIPQLSTFVSGIIGTSKGIDQNTFFAFMEENMKTLARENLRRELQKRPGRFKAATWAVAGCGLLMYVAPVISSIADGLKAFG
ncbi:Flp pilus assembly protein TadB [Anaerobacterium chartisolvens]|uniref:Flp pilus assembly protein TadB n=1 Tax=Anaerobacterium chartisolvens TaxID=1297424 RepID=A0A369AMX5_9FIRM|nr:Flp pilus assembly protein TadB [Anaerobacterium chartisolvens]